LKEQWFYKSFYILYITSRHPAKELLVFSFPLCIIVKLKPKENMFYKQKIFDIVL